jgi:molybdenum cofactor cytidylyltransferase
MNKKVKISAVILAAGYSKRMGRDKFTLKYDNQRTFLEKIVDDYLDFGCFEIVVVLNSKGMEVKNSLPLEFPDKIKFILNTFPEKERFYSIKSGLSVLSQSDFVFIHNVDNPFFSRDLLTKLSNSKYLGDYIVPFFATKGGHPILLSRKIIEELNKEINDQLNFKVFLEKFRSIKIQIDNSDILININEPISYDRLFNHILPISDEQTGKK